MNWPLLAKLTIAAGLLLAAFGLFHMTYLCDSECIADRATYQTPYWDSELTRYGFLITLIGAAWRAVLSETGIETNG